MIENIIITVIISEGLGGVGVMKSHDVCCWVRLGWLAGWVILRQTKHPAKLVLQITLVPSQLAGQVLRNIITPASQATRQGCIVRPTPPLHSS